MGRIGRIRLSGSCAAAGAAATIGVRVPVVDPPPLSRETRAMSQDTPLRHRNFAWFWAGQSASIAGTGIFRVALPLEVLRVTGNPLDLALVLALDLAPTLLFLLVGGALVDRLSRRRIMLVSDVLNGLVMLLVTSLIATGQVMLWHLVVLSLISGTATAVYL